MENLHMPEAARSFFSMAKSVGKFALDRFRIRGWSELPADPTGANITIIKGEE